MATLGTIKEASQDAKDRLAKAENGLAKAEGRLAKVEDRLAKAKDRLAEAEDGLAEAEDGLAEAEDRLADWRSGKHGGQWLEKLRDVAMDGTLSDCEKNRLDVLEMEEKALGEDVRSCRNRVHKWEDQVHKWEDILQEFITPSAPFALPTAQKRKAAEALDSEYRKSLKRTWEQTLNNPTYLDHRPTSATGIPTELIHPVFGDFFDDCRTSMPTSEDYVFVVRLCEGMSEFYNSESSRAEVVRKLFDEYFGINLRPTNLGGSNNSSTDGTWFPNSTKAYIALNVKVKKESGSSNNLHLENQAYYLQYIEHNWEEFSKTTRLPCFLVQVHGADLSIYTTILADKVTVDPYPFTLSLSCTPSGYKDFARIFHAFRKALRALGTYYNDPLPEVTPEQRRFPYPNSFKAIATNTDGGKNITFSYHKAWGSNPLIFLVDINEKQEGLPDRLLVKFSQQYSKKVHEDYANVGIAPKLYGFEVLPGGWYMVVMEHMTNYKTLLESGYGMYRDNVKDAIAKLHGLGYVHGDIREANIMVRECHPPHVVLIV